MLEYQKNLGKHSSKDVILKEGKFGLYLNWDDKNYGFKDDFENKEDCTLEQAIDIIKQKDDKNIKIFNKTTKIMNGLYGPFILHGKKIVSVPKEIEDPAKLTLKEAKDIVENASPKKGNTSKFPDKKQATKDKKIPIKKSVKKI